MADPVSIIGVLSTADVVFSRLFKYIKSVKTAERDVLDLAGEVQHLCCTLQSIKTAADALKDHGGHSPLIDGKLISDCFNTVDELREILSKYQLEHRTDTSTKLVKGRLKWPLDKTKVHDLKSKIHDHNVAFATTLSAESLSRMIEVLSKTTSVATTIERVDKLLEAAAHIEVDKKTQEILSIVGPIRPMGHQKTNAQLHHPGTGIWFLESDDFKSWLTTPNSKLWVFGIPGAGKSILASAAIEKALGSASPDNAVAYFYCDYKHPEMQDPVKILGSLAEQIARQDARSFEKLKAFAYAHTQNRDLQAFFSTEEELCKLIIDMADNFESTMILVDGLDECEDVRKATACLAALGDTPAYGSPRIKTFLSSREIPDVEDFMLGYQRVSIAARNGDLRLYVAAELENRMKPNNVRRLRIKDPGLKGEIMDVLINGAEGMFRWVAVQLDSFCEMPSDFDIREALASLPRGLFPSYERVLDRINRKPKLTKHLVQCALKWITYHNMEVEALIEALAVKEDTRKLTNVRKCDVEDILLHCESLVRLSSDGRFVELAHFTVKEYLAASVASTRPDLADYRLNFEIDKQYLAATALTYLTCDDFKHIPLGMEEASRRYFHRFQPFRDEAVMHWMTFARGCSGSLSVRSPLMRLLDLEHICCFTSWVQEYLSQLSLSRDHTLNFDSYNLEESRVRVLDGWAKHHIEWQAFTPLHWAAMLRLPELCRSLNDAPGLIQRGSPFGTPLHMALVGAQFGNISASSLSSAILGEDETIAGEEACLLETVRVLIDGGADVNARWMMRDDTRSTSALAIALRINRLDCIELLLSAGAICGPDMIERLVEWLDELDSRPVRFTRDDIARMIESIPQDAVAEGAKEAFSTLIARLCTEPRKSTGPSHALEALSRVGGVHSQQQNLLDSARFSHEKAMELLLQNPSIDCNIKNSLGESALMLAAKCCTVPMVRMLLAHGAELEIADNQARTPLHYAVQCGLLDVVEFLITSGANPLLTDDRGWTVWHFVASRRETNSRQVLNLLLQHTRLRSNAVDASGLTPWLVAVEAGNAEIVSFLETGGADIWCKDSSGRTAIHIAAGGGYVELLRSFLAAGLDPAVADAEGHNALWHATAKIDEDASSFRLLCQHAPGLLLSKTSQGTSAFDRLLDLGMWDDSYKNPAAKALAVEIIPKNRKDIFLGVVTHIMESELYNTGSYEVLKLIIDQGPMDSINLDDGDGSLKKTTDCLARAMHRILTCNLDRIYLDTDQLVSPPLVRICTILIDHLPELCLRRLRVSGYQILTIGLRRSDAVARAILNRYVDLESQDLEIGNDKNCYNALEHAFASSCSDAIFQRILDVADSFTSKTALGDSLLHVAAQSGFEDRVQFLLTKGLDPHEKGQHDNSALHLACRYNRGQNAKLLLEAGANPWSLNSDGISPVQLAIESGAIDFVRLIPVEGDCWRGTYPYKTSTGIIHLKLHHLAVLHNRLDCLKHLLSLSEYFKVDDMLESGATMLSISVEQGFHSIVTFLLSNGAKLHSYKDGCTVLHAAAQVGELQTVKALLKHGLDPLQVGSSDRTPLSIAIGRGFKDVISAMKTSITERVSLDQSVPLEGDINLKMGRVSDSHRRELKYAIDSNDLELCRQLVSQKHSEVQACSCCGSVNGLLYALRHGKEDIALYLLETGSQPDQLIHGRWNTLQICAYFNLPRALQQVMNKCPKLLFLKTTFNPLHLAVLGQHNECLKIMLERSTAWWQIVSTSREAAAIYAGMDSVTADMRTGTHLRSESPNRFQMIAAEDLLGVQLSIPEPDAPELAKNISAVELRVAGATTALQCAAYVDNVEATRLLLKYGARVDQQSSPFLETALHIAIKRQAFGVIPLLLDYGAAVNQNNFGGWSCSDMVKYYLSGTAVDSRLLGLTPIREPGRLGGGSIVADLVVTARVLELAESVKNRHGLTAVNAVGLSALCRCWERGPLVMQTYLLNSGFDLSGSTTCFGSALNHDWQDPEVGLLKRFLRRLGRIQSRKLLNFRPKHRDTPLYRAAAQAQIAVLRLLLLHGADMNIIGGPMGTPLIAAASYGRLNIVKELVNADASFSCFCPKFDETVNVYDQARNFPTIQSWLLFDRWTERKCIGWVEYASCSGGSCDCPTSVDPMS